jgi:hypothetical protein
VDDLLHNLSAHRRRIKGARTADAALRWAVSVSVAGCIALAVSKVAGLALPLALAGGVLGAIPLAMALREWARAFSLRDCAIHLDRLLGLEERLSTALEAVGPMGPVVRADAAAAMGRAPLPSRRLPREARLLGGSLLLAGALLTLPSPDRSGTRIDPALAAVSAEQAARLESLAHVDVQFKEVAEQAARALREGQPEKALAILEDLRRKLAEKLLEGGGAGAETQKLLDDATSSAAAISAELARLGRTIHAAPPVVAQAKLDRQRGSEAAVATDPAPGTTPAGRAAISQDVPWDPRYDPVIRRYLGIGREP